MEKKQLLYKLRDNNLNGICNPSLDTTRYESFGGSEVPTLLGKNKYQSIPDLIARKLGLIEFPAKLITSWGNTLEENTRLIAEDLFDCEIIYTGKLPVKDGLHYTMDGMGNAILQDNDNAYRYKNILFEFKNPYSRKTEEGVIQKHYEDQPLLGMHGLVDAQFDTSIFMETTVRFCHRDEFDFSTNYSNNLNTSNYIPPHAPIALGIVFIVRPLESERSYMEDIATLKYYDLEEIFNQVKIENYQTIFTKPAYNRQLYRKYINAEFRKDSEFKKTVDFDEEVMNVLNYCEANNMEPVAYGCFKTFEINIVRVDKDGDYLNEVYPTIEKYVKILQDCNFVNGQRRTKDDRKKKLKEYFPNYKNKNISGL